MGSYKKCPACHGILEEDDSCSCGWSLKKKRASKRDARMFEHSRIVADHAIDASCQWLEKSGGCDMAGFVSLTTGGEGPWYCRDHLAQLRGQKFTHINPPIAMDMASVDARVNKLVPRKGGESITDWTNRCRLWTLETLRAMKSKNARLHMTDQEEEVLVQEEPGAMG